MLSCYYRKDLIHDDEISQEEREWIDTRFETIFLKSHVAELFVKRMSTRMIVTRVEKTLT